jgi:hypothetical protein
MRGAPSPIHASLFVIRQTLQIELAMTGNARLGRSMRRPAAAVRRPPAVVRWIVGRPWSSFGQLESGSFAGAAIR